MLIEKSNKDFLLVGIAKGGGLECSKLNEEGYRWENKTGEWMRVAAFKEEWIDKETSIGRTTTQT